LEITWPAFSSCSLDQSIAQHYSRLGVNIPTVFKITTRNYKDITALLSGQEKEVLCPAGTKLKFVTKEAPNIIVLEEIGTRLTSRATAL
jgi:hypothetical protein